MRNNDIDKIQLISFFTGGGFMDIGFEQAGFEIVWTNENNPLFAEMYASGISNMHMTTGRNTEVNIIDTRSIVDITSSEIEPIAFRNKKPSLFGVIGGPPCQDFSVAGNIEGFNGEKGKLTEVFYERIRELSPAFFVMENVEGLWTIKRHRERLIEILNGINDKFVIIKNILNAIEFGVAQDRKRLFIIGFSKDYFENAEFEVIRNFNWPKELFKDALTKYSWPTRQTYPSRRKKPKGLPIELCVQSCLVNDSSRNIANANETFNAYSKKFHIIEEGDTRNQSFKRLHRYRYSPTACYGNNEVHLHPYLPRRLSVRETLRIQGVPDTYELPPIIGEGKRHVGLSSKFKMIGNGVPVPLAKHIGDAVKNFIDKQLTKRNGYLDKGKAQPSDVENPVEEY